MIILNPNAIYTAREVGKMLHKCERTVRRMARRLGKPRGSMFSAAEVRQIVGAR